MIRALLVTFLASIVFQKHRNDPNNWLEKPTGSLVFANVNWNKELATILHRKKTKTSKITKPVKCTREPSKSKLGIFIRRISKEPRWTRNKNDRYCNFSLWSNHFKRNSILKMEWVWTKVTVVRLQNWQEEYEFHAGFCAQSQVSDIWKVYWFISNKIKIILLRFDKWR